MCYTPFRFNAAQGEANATKTAPQEKESRQNHPANIIAVRNSRNRKLRALWIRGTADAPAGGYPHCRNEGPVLLPRGEGAKFHLPMFYQYICNW
jgi:hypothetical protein